MGAGGKGVTKTRRDWLTLAVSHRVTRPRLTGGPLTADGSDINPGQKSYQMAEIFSTRFYCTDLVDFCHNLFSKKVPQSIR